MHNDRLPEKMIILTHGDGDDTLFGGLGDDILYGDFSLIGGSGADFYLEEVVQIRSSSLLQMIPALNHLQEI